MSLKITIVDAFTQELFRGNPAAVILLEVWLPEQTMQRIASENNLSETAFVVGDDEGVFHIRWFSPVKEIDFCGHATLACAHVIFAQQPERNNIDFWAAAVGRIPVAKGEHGLIKMMFPNREPKVIDAIPAALSSGLSLEPVAYLKNEQAYFAIYADEEGIHSVVPDLNKLKMLAPFDVVVTAPGKTYDFVSRYFWPANGGVEDPVTGSIHAGLAPYWAQRLGKNALVAYQASARSGVLYCQLEGQNIAVSGYCVNYLEGVIQI